ncbi:MAG: hypothetical protein M3220_22415 [Chloroflexota bacterium]|nr:hypothetical protein [Chloroflexota bacterium]
MPPAQPLSDEHLVNLRALDGNPPSRASVQLPNSRPGACGVVRAASLTATISSSV